MLEAVWVFSPEDNEDQLSLLDYSEDKWVAYNDALV
jgi:hypothetical protein